MLGNLSFSLCLLRSNIIRDSPFQSVQVTRQSRLCARSLRLKRFKSSNRIQLNPLSFLCKQGTCASQFIFSPAKCFSLLGNLSFSLCLLRSNIIHYSPFQNVQVTRQSCLCARSLRLKRFKSSNRIQPNPLSFLCKQGTCASISQSFLSLALSFFQWPVVKAIKALIDSIRQFSLDFFSSGFGQFYLIVKVFFDFVDLLVKIFICCFNLRLDFRFNVILLLNMLGNRTLVRILSIVSSLTICADTPSQTTFKSKALT